MLNETKSRFFKKVNTEKLLAKLTKKIDNQGGDKEGFQHRFAHLRYGLSCSECKNLVSSAYPRSQFVGGCTHLHRLLPFRGRAYTLKQPAATLRISELCRQATGHDPVTTVLQKSIVTSKTIL